MLESAHFPPSPQANTRTCPDHAALPRQTANRGRPPRGTRGDCTKCRRACYQRGRCDAPVTRVTRCPAFRTGPGVTRIGCGANRMRRESDAARTPVARNAGTSVTSGTGVMHPPLVSPDVLHFVRASDVAGRRSPASAGRRSPASAGRRIPASAGRANGRPHANPEPGKTPLCSSRWRAATALRNALHQWAHERMLTPAPSSVGRYGDFGVSHPLRRLRSGCLHRRE